MRRDRLKKLELALRTYAHEQPKDFKFSLVNWYQWNRNECGYTGCAIGIALHYKLFEDETFRDIDGYGRFRRVREFFELPPLIAQKLFLPSYQKFGVPLYGADGALATAVRIRDLLGPDEVVTVSIKTKVLEPV